jgi:nucleotide-binding universal stress UspA family protein
MSQCVLASEYAPTQKPHEGDWESAHRVQAEVTRGLNLDVTGLHSGFRASCRLDFVPRGLVAQSAATAPGGKEARVKRFARIMACTDFSEPGDRAIEAAFSLAPDGDATVVLVHVVDALHIPNPMYAHYYRSDEWSPEVQANAQSEARQALERLVPKKATGGERQVEMVVGHGRPIDEIVRIAEEHAADLIVVGTQGHSAIAHLLLGSVAERIVRHAPCSVLLVR